MEVRLNGNGFFRVTSHFKAIDSAHTTPHMGTDLAMRCGTPLKSPTGGVIENVVDYGSKNIGKGVIIKTDANERLILGHLSDNSQVHIGQQVSQGDLIGISGTTGNSTGCHLHIGLRDGKNQFIDPGKYFNGQESESIVKVTDNIQSVSPGDILQQALSELADTLANLGLNFIHWSSQLFSIQKGHLILDLVLSWL